MSASIDSTLVLRLEGILDGPFQPIIKLRNLAIADVTHEGDHLALFQRQHVSKDS
jgi:hypothetical protein